MKHLKRSLPLYLVLVATWLLLQGEWSAGNVAGGAIVGAGLCALFPVSDDVVAHRLHPWAFLRFIVFVLYSLVMSSWAVIKVIIRPTPASLRSGIVRVPLTVESPLTSTIVANAVTLTPGTMTLTARLHPAELQIHVLGLGDAAEFRESVFDLERRTVAAFTPILDKRRSPLDEDPDGGTR